MIPWVRLLKLNSSFIAVGRNMSEMIVGIDLGTTNSLCAVFAEGEPRLIKNAHGGFLTPSVVGVMEDEQVVVGAPAREYRVTHPESCCFAFKRHMGTDRKLKLGKKEFSSTELSSLVLRSLKEDAESELGQEIKQAVITVPAYFNDGTTQGDQESGRDGGPARQAHYQ